MLLWERRSLHRTDSNIRMLLGRVLVASHSVHRTRYCERLPPFTSQDNSNLDLKSPLQFPCNSLWSLNQHHFAYLLDFDSIVSHMRGRFRQTVLVRLKIHRGCVGEMVSREPLELVAVQVFWVRA